jgi:hypothetical protein
MVQVEITGSQEVIEGLREKVEPMSSDGVRTYRHGGLGGEAGIYGLLATVLAPLLPKLIDLVKLQRAKDRDLKISFNGVELVARDIREASEVMQMLSDRGIVPGEMKDAEQRN